MFFFILQRIFSHFNFNGAIFHAIHSVTLKVCFYECFWYVAGEFQEVFSINIKFRLLAKPDYIPCELSCSRTAIFMLLLLCFLFFISVYVDKNFSIHMPFNICQKYYLYDLWDTFLCVVFVGWFHNLENGIFLWSR